jgi:hypothetical protein
VAFISGALEANSAEIRQAPETRLLTSPDSYRKDPNFGKRRLFVTQKQTAVNCRAMPWKTIAAMTDSTEVP